MRKILALVLLLVLTASCAGGAFAERAQYANTKTVVDTLDAMEIVYTLCGLDEDNDEELDIKNRDDHFDYTIKAFFTPDNETISLRVWYLMTYDADDTESVLKVINQLHNDYKFVTFVADLSDNTITAKMDLIVRENDAVGEIFGEALYYIDSIIGKSYDSLSPYIK